MTNSSSTSEASTSSSDTTYLFFSALIVMMLFARFISYFFYRLKAPRIVGDIVAGCLLGPTVLQSSANSTLFVSQNSNVIHAVGYLGLICASMTSGANFNPRVLHGQLWRVVAFSVVNIGVSFAAAMGAIYSLPHILTDPHFIGTNFNETSFKIYFACAFCATSLPMTFLILDELKLTNALAKFCIGTSTVATVLLFTLVSIASSFVHTDDSALGSPGQLIPFRICMLGVIVIGLFGIKKAWEHGLVMTRDQSATSWFHRTSTDQSLFIISLCIGVAVASNALGYTFVLGAFLMGAFLPVDLVAADGQPVSHIRTDFTKLIKWYSRWVLLPMFFLDIGLQFDLRYVNEFWWEVFVLLSWGYVAKLSTVLFAKFGLGFTWNEAWFCGWLANCRGFNALVVGEQANADKQFGPVSFTVCVLFSVTSSAFAGFMCKYFHNREASRLTELAKMEGSTAILATSKPVPDDDEQEREDKDTFEINPFWKDEVVLHLSVAGAEHEEVAAAGQHHPHPSQDGSSSRLGPPSALFNASHHSVQPNRHVPNSALTNSSASEGLRSKPTLNGNRHVDSGGGNSEFAVHQNHSSHDEAENLAAGVELTQFQATPSPMNADDVQHVGLPLPSPSPDITHSNTATIATANTSEQPYTNNIASTNLLDNGGSH